jgi:hypothetical protein
VVSDTNRHTNTSEVLVDYQDEWTDTSADGIELDPPYEQQFIDGWDLPSLFGVKDANLSAQPGIDSCFFVRKTIERAVLGTLGFSGPPDKYEVGDSSSRFRIIWESVDYGFSFDDLARFKYILLLLDELDIEALSEDRIRMTLTINRR